MGMQVKTSHLSWNSCCLSCVNMLLNKILWPFVCFMQFFFGSSDSLNSSLVANPKMNAMQGPGPWRKSIQPHALSTRLSRFRSNVNIPSAEEHALANTVFQARCEVISSRVCSPIALNLSSDGAGLQKHEIEGTIERIKDVFVNAQRQKRIRSQRGLLATKGM